MSSWDSNRLLQFMITNSEVFSRFGLTPQHRPLLYELKRARNDWAHQASFSDEELYRILDNIHRILLVIDAPVEAQIIDNTRKELIITMAHKIAQERSRQNSPSPNLLTYKPDVHQILERLMQPIKLSPSVTSTATLHSKDEAQPTQPVASKLTPFPTSRDYGDSMEL